MIWTNLLIAVDGAKAGRLFLLMWTYLLVNVERVRTDDLCVSIDVD